MGCDLICVQNFLKPPPLSIPVLLCSAPSETCHKEKNLEILFLVGAPEPPSTLSSRQSKSLKMNWDVIFYMCK